MSQQSEDAIVPAELIRAGAGGRLCMVLGPKVAEGTGIPSPDEAARRLFEKAIVQAPEPRREELQEAREFFAEPGDVRDKFALLGAIMGDPFVDGSLWAELRGAAAKPNSSHEALAGIDALFLTTGPDELLQTAKRALGKRCVTGFVDDDDASAIPRAGDVLALGGTLAKPGVLRFARPARALTERQSARLRAVLADISVIVFMGFSARDEELAEVAKMLQEARPERSYLRYWLAPKDARIRAKAAKLGIEPLWLGADTTEETFVGALSRQIAVHDAERSSFWPLPENTADDTKQLLHTGHRNLALGDLAAAADVGLQVCAKYEAKTEPQLLLEGLSILEFALGRTMFEDPPDAKLIAVDERARVLEVLEEGLSSLVNAPMPWKKRAYWLADRFGALTQDTETWTARFGDIEGAKDDSENNPFASKDAGALSKAHELAEAGRVEEALAQIPKFDHPWKEAYFRGVVLLACKQRERALITALEACRAFPGRGPLESLCGLLLRQQSRHEEALEHAQRAFDVFPSRGERALLGEALLFRGRNAEAWQLWEPLADCPRAHLIGLRALVAEAVAPDEAGALFAKYIELTPENVDVRLVYAHHEAKRGNTETAAEISWQLVSRAEKREYDAETLYKIAHYQTAPTGPISDEARRRVEQIADELEKRFIGDARAAQLRKALEKRLTGGAGADETPTPMMVVAPNAPMLEGQATRETLQQSYEDMGGPSFERLCIELGKSPAALFKELSEPTPFRLLPALALATFRDEADPPRLDGKRFLVGALELCIFDVLDLWEPLATALGAQGRLVVFQDITDKIAASASGSEAEAKLARAIEAGLHAKWLVTTTRPAFAQEGPVTATRDALHRQLHFFVNAEIGYFQALSEDRDLTLICSDIMTASPNGVMGRFAEIAQWPPEAPTSHQERMMHLFARFESLPRLVRGTFVANEAEKFLKLERLAELGFADAFRPEDLLSLARRFGGIDREEPARLLNRAERLARKAGHAAQEPTCLTLGFAYADAIWAVSCGEDAWPESEARALTLGLLQRADDLDTATLTAMTEHIFDQLGRSTLHFPMASTAPTSENMLALADDSPAGRLWAFINAWTGKTTARTGALHRALRRVWHVVDNATKGVGPSGNSAAPLMIATFRAFAGGSPSLLGGFDAPAILSATWQEQPFGSAAISMLDAEAKVALRYPVADLLPFMTNELARNAALIAGAACFTQIPPAGSHPAGRLGVRMEALLLRLAGDKISQWARTFAHLQGQHDGRAYTLWMALAASPNDEAIRKECASESVSMPFVLFREDPTILLKWYRYRHVDFPQSIDELCAMLSEPELPADTQPMTDQLHQRIGVNGAWSKRSDAGDLFGLATQVPGIISMLPALLPWPQNVMDFSTTVAAYMQILSQPDDQPAGRIATAIFFLRSVAEYVQHIQLPQGQVDLRERLPERFVGLLDQMEQPPAKGTLAAHEAGLLRLAAQQVKRLDREGKLTTRQHLWLSYRLFQWIVLQLDSLSPTARLAAYEQIGPVLPAAHVEQASDDLLDPMGFERERGIDYRLASVLFALSQMNAMAQRGEATEEEPKPAVEPWRFSSPMLEAKFAKLATRALTEREKRIRVRGIDASALDWSAPATIADLGLSALLTSRIEGLTKLSEADRLRWIDDLPADEADRSHAPWAIGELVFAGLNTVAATLGEHEVAAYEERLRQLPADAKDWQWVGLTALFRWEKGSTTESDVLELLVAHLDRPNVAAVFGSALVGVAQRDVKQLEPFVERVLNAAIEQNIDPVPLAQGLGFVLMLSKKKAAVRKARELLKGLSERAPFQNDERMQALVATYGLR